MNTKATGECEQELNSQDVSVQETQWSRARIDKGISLEDISERTHIPVRKLNAIELRDYADLGRETFALGYIRSYAKIVECDADTIVEDYRVKASEGSFSTERRCEPLELTKKPSRKFGILHISIAVIVIWGGLVAYFSDSSDESEVPPASENEQSLPAKVEQPSINDSVIEQTAANEDVINTAGVESNEYEPQTGVNSLATLAQVQIETSVSDVVVLPEAVSPSSASSALSATTASSVSSSATAPLSTNESASTSSTPITGSQSMTSSGEDRLLFSFSEDCWVEVSDAQGKVLIAEVGRKEHNLQIFGQAPFAVMLGNARVATLAINGRAVSVQPRGSNKTLRMTVAR